MSFLSRYERKDRRRNRTGERKTYQVGQLWDRHHEIFRLSLLGMSNVRIAETLGITPVTVSSCLNSDIGRAKLSVMRGARDAETIDVAVEIKKMIPRALEVYEKILNAGPEDKVSMTLKKATADTIVKELGGFEAPKKVAVAGHFTFEEIEAIKERGKKMAAAIGSVVDI